MDFPNWRLVQFWRKPILLRPDDPALFHGDGIDSQAMATLFLYRVDILFPRDRSRANIGRPLQQFAGAGHTFGRNQIFVGGGT